MTIDELEINMWNEGLSFAQLESEDPENSLNKRATIQCVRTAILYAIEVLEQLRKDLGGVGALNYPITAVDRKIKELKSQLK